MLDIIFSFFFYSNYSVFVGDKYLLHFNFFIIILFIFFFCVSVCVWWSIQDKANEY